MVQTSIGLHQGMKLCQKSTTERLSIIAEGLPIILDSAQSFYTSSLQLANRRREAEVLAGFANEEAAKILILMDVARCPEKHIGVRIRPMMKWFYNHLARLLYIESVHWKPIHVAQLQEYMDTQRKTHFVEGFAGEYILPNWSVYMRESLLYADMEAYEDGKIGWNTPHGHPSVFGSTKPTALCLIDSMSRLGIFSDAGLKITSQVWQATNFKDTANHHNANELVQEMLSRLGKAGLQHKDASQDDVDTLYNYWQIPMYNIDFGPIEVSLEELENERDALMWAEMGDYLDVY